MTAAGQMIGRVERAVEEAAVAGLRAVAGKPAPFRRCGRRRRAKSVSVPGDLAAVMRSHASMHASEGMLYRDAVLAAARRCGWAAHAVEMSSLPAAEQSVAAVGRAAGRPWRRIEKDATRAAIALLPQTPSQP